MKQHPIANRPSVDSTITINEATNHDAQPFGDACELARVVRVDRGSCLVRTKNSSSDIRITTDARLAVGDWVAVTLPAQSQQPMIEAVLPQRGVIHRGAAGGTTVAQVVAANVDVPFIVCSLEVSVNMRRVERFLVATWQQGIQPVVVLSKADLATDEIPEIITETQRMIPGVDVVAVSTLDQSSLQPLRQYLADGKTGVLLGQSGVGKSSIINCLARHEVLEVQETRGDGKGRHTTTHRELIELPCGGVIIDTPGIRELRLWDAEEGINQTFNDIKQLAECCKFNDCAHESEPGCAILDAIDKGDLDADRFASYCKLQREAQRLEQRQNKRAQSEQRKSWRVQSRALRKTSKRRR